MHQCNGPPQPTSSQALICSGVRVLGIFFFFKFSGKESEEKNEHLMIGWHVVYYQIHVVVVLVSLSLCHFIENMNRVEVTFIREPNHNKLNQITESDHSISILAKLLLLIFVIHPSMYSFINMTFVT